MKRLLSICHHSLKFVTCATLLLLPLSSYGHHNCQKFDKKIAKVESKLRAGYSVKQGEKLKKKLTGLKDKRRRCENTRHRKK